MGYERMSENPDKPSSSNTPGSGWTRPQAMRKDQNSTAWLVLLGLVCLGVATWSLLYGVYWKRRESVQRAALEMAKRESDEHEPGGAVLILAHRLWTRPRAARTIGGAGSV